MTPAGWLYYIVAVAGAVAIFLLLPAGPAGCRSGRAALGTLIGVAALAGLVVWLMTLHRARTVIPVEEHPGVESLFYLFAVIALSSAVRVIVHPRPVYSVVYFVTAALAVGGILLLTAAQFLAIALILIYAGAIMVVYVFVIMLAQHAGGSASPAGGGDDPAGYDLRARQPVGGLLAGFLLLAAFARLLANPANLPTVTGTPMEQMAAGRAVGNTAAIGQQLFRGNLLALELAGVLLLVAIIGAIAIARKRVGPADLVRLDKEQPNG